MKRLLFVCAVLSMLTACKEQESGNTTTPKGIIIEAVTALSQNRSNDFNQLLSGVAAQKYSSVEIQKDLLKSLGDIRKITLGSEKVLSHDVGAIVTSTVSSVDVIKSGNAIYTVVIRCDQTSSTSSHTVCTRPVDTTPYYPPSHSYNPPSHNYNPPSHSYNPPSRDDDNSGYITPGRSHEADPGSSSDDGHKPGNQDPGRPGRFEATYSFGDECHEVTDYNTSVSCKIIDLQ